MKNLLRITAFLLLPFPVLAENATLGRLFLTPAERAALDIVRQNNKAPEKIIDSSTVEEENTTEVAPTELLPVITVQGYVKRNDGKGTVWVNGQPVREKSAEQAFEVGRLHGNTSQVQIRLPAASQTVKLKPGQSYDPVSHILADSPRDLPARHTEGLPDPNRLVKDDKTGAGSPTAATAAASPAPTR
ncbi:MAG: hypothetical protein N2Z69_00375 [Methylophilaceae bacterium]|nr:hypothetical protein [Methylophilaceae bacterium]